jgi:lipoate-protein ligase A
MHLYNLGKVPWQETQLIYHAPARLGRESLVLVSPERQGLPFAFCKDKGRCFGETPGA